MKYNFTLENLNCAHCAGKIENKLAETDGYELSLIHISEPTRRS